MEIDLSNDFTIIRTQNIFNDLVSGSCHPEIDFGIYDLIIGKKGLVSGNSSIDYELTENCETHNQNLKVTFNQNATMIAPNLTYHALIPKLENRQTVSVDIEINN